MAVVAINTRPPQSFPGYLSNSDGDPNTNANHDTNRIGNSHGPVRVSDRHAETVHRLPQPHSQSPS